MTVPSPGRILFVTGRLAAPALEQVLEGLRGKSDIPCDVLELPISVAALMTPAWALSQLGRADIPEGTERIVMPGRVSGDLSAMREALGIAVELGPQELWDIPAYLGFEGSAFELPGELARPKLLAEIADAWRMTPEAILERAEVFRRDGADYIDLGGNPESGLPDVERKVTLLKANNFKVSVDAFHEETLTRADGAGADMLLSVNGSNLGLAGQVGCPVVVIPDFQSGNRRASLEKNVEAVRRAGGTAIADPILDPPLMGFVRSLRRFQEYRATHPGDLMLMGTGNVTELLEADSTGVNALLAACLCELRIDYVLTTEIAEWTRGTVRELALANRVMAAARARATLPKRVTKGLRPLKGPVSRCEIESLKRMRGAITDENWRVFVAEGRICAFNRDKFLCAPRAAEIYAEMEVRDPAHAFYLGCELQKAEIALSLGRVYVQDDPLTWGVLS